MNYVLDTHAFLWIISDETALSLAAKSLIIDPENSLYLSIASIWEIGIKASIGKLEVASPFTDFINQQMRESNVILLDIKIEHIRVVATLPLHHRDPFDRLIVAQSLHEKLPIIGKDTIFDSYGITRHW